MYEIKAEDFCKNKLDGIVYPITLVKFLLNRSKILRLKEVKNYDLFDIKPEDCSDCQSISRPDQSMCRIHTSIQRIQEAERIVKDLDSGMYFVKNEIFYPVQSGITFVAYCPHTKLMRGPITCNKVRIFTSFFTSRIDTSQFENKVKKEFSSDKLTEHQIQCWFNEEFYIVLLPNGTYSYSDFVLKPTR
jgi:hypothetical protein